MKPMRFDVITPVADSNPEGDETVILTINDATTGNYIAGTPDRPRR